MRPVSSFPNVSYSPLQSPPAVPLVQQQHHQTAAAGVATRILSSCSSGHLQSYCTRLVGTFLFLLLTMQFVVNFSAYHSPLFTTINELQPEDQLPAGHPSRYNRKTFRLENMAWKSASRVYLSDSSDSLSAGADDGTVTGSQSSVSPAIQNNETDKQPAHLHANASQSSLRDCPAIPPKLVGRLKVMLETPPLSQLNKMYPFIESGGRFRPKECKARHRVAIIIPYRDRDDHLRAFLHNIHPILSRQQIDYGIFVIEEVPNVQFNRAKLMNIGFKEALKSYDYQCFIFHDVDLLPEDDRNLYTCPDQPRHMSVAVNTMNYKLPYRDIFGGVSALTREQMLNVNGFSNEFWGWGGEDDDMSNRVRNFGYRITRYRGDIGRYHMLKHKKDTPNPNRYKTLYKGRERFKSDGLNSLDYKVIKKEERPLYTWILVDPLFKKS